MPIYEYECTACGHHMEILQKMSEAPLKKCEECGKLKLEKLISHTSFQLKGGGWYADLYGSSKDTTTKPESKETAKSEAKTEAKAEAKAEAKSEAKTEAKAKSETKSEAKPKKAAKTDNKAAAA